MSNPPPEGLMAVNKPPGISSASVLRSLQTIFNPSQIFAESLQLERLRRQAESRNQKNRRRKNSARSVQVKIGHGGTLDPMASGVLIAGIGAATKQLSQFLQCTKTYEATMLFGADTDSYDSAGKVTKWASWEGITREKVEKALDNFRGDILQKPPIYSALHMNGKRLYQYAREGKPLPVEIQPRPVHTESLYLIDYTFDHNYTLLEDEGEQGEKAIIEALDIETNDDTESGEQRLREKRPRSLSLDAGRTLSKKQKKDAEQVDQTPTPVKHEPLSQSPAMNRPETPPLAVTLRMTVTSGFYVRSLIHDLGHALGSAAYMVKLVRTRQGDYQLGQENVMEWEELMENPEEIWGPKVKAMLSKWSQEK